MHKDRAEIWWMEVAAITDDQWQRMETWLDQAERDRAGRFKFASDRHTYVAAHVLGRFLLSSWQSQVMPVEWRFSLGDHGKPEVVVAEAMPRYRLNLSHTGGLAAAALTIDHPIGIDVEWLDRRPPDCLALAERFFAASECDLVRQTAPDQRMLTFLGLWTLKEAYVKAIGKGLAQPLDAFAFTLDPVAIRFDGDDDPGRWLFRRFSPTPRHLMALALGHDQPAQVEVTARPVTFAQLAGGGAIRSP
ncbi:putative 4'-phosphopantetheinyl transferase [Magnetospirillum gryphiswaldense MSR-1 v2]|uniref:4'-phosphopantetheinyl transferase n=1 Tax=Magnetospirillum gryphiswaldense (strain DSM 6361 / JCM 21280 / NBRC 15271 / MSR-1) TaxID=431944 RepID=V6F0F1_MAGGM|nr:4'-phosphopantetheinyl transferase superfamily protein [Magnetospirillum gryphiswaldense]CDK97973.1 putative 4'-phosphopantetheinyl transferase [Magnetospirillum gryphiswaldense MSR-1 v2]